MTTTTPSGPKSRVQFIGIVSRTAPFIAFLSLFIASWRRWTPLIVDSGREIDLPNRLLEGELLYRDIHYLYPPLAPYVNGLLYWLFGVRLEVLNCAGILTSIVIVILCFRIARRFLEGAEATIAVSAVIVWCIFKPEGNLVAPYAFAALYAMVFALATLLTTLRYGEGRRWREVVVAGLLIGLAGISKQEFALVSAVTWTAGVAFCHRRDLWSILTRVGAAALVSIAIAAPVYGYFLSRVGWTTLIDDCHLLYTRIPASLIFYNSARTGVDHPLLSIWQILGGAAVSTTIVAAITLASRAGGSLRRWCAVLLVGGASLALIVGLTSGGRWDGSPFRSLPLVLVGVMLFSIFWKKNDHPRYALFVVAVYSLMALIRVVLRVPSGGAFGGYFLPTSLLLVVYLLARALPSAIRWYSEKYDDTQPRLAAAGRARAIGLGAIAVWLLATAIVFGYRYRHAIPSLIETPRGSLYVSRVLEPATKQALVYLQNHSSDGDRVVIVPEGSMISFLAKRRMPLRHQILIPDFMDQREEQLAIDEMKGSKLILLINRPTREFGSEAFGRDYYTSMGRFLRERCRLELVCGVATDPALEIGAREFFIKIFSPADSSSLAQ